jgi:hypothetical protein
MPHARLDLTSTNSYSMNEWVSGFVFDRKSGHCRAIKNASVRRESWIMCEREDAPFVAVSPRPSGLAEIQDVCSVTARVPGSAFQARLARQRCGHPRCFVEGLIVLKVENHSGLVGERGCLGKIVGFGEGRETAGSFVLVLQEPENRLG